MSRKKLTVVLAILLAAFVVFFTSSCKKLNPSRLKSTYHFNRANSLFSDAKYRDAIEEYEAALEYNPELSEAYRYLGESYKNLYKPGVDSPENMEKAEKALEALKKAYKIDPKNREIIHSLGNMYDMMRNLEEAEHYYLMILDLEPTNMENYYVVAGFYKRYAAENEELKNKAEQMYLRRIELDPENPKGYSYIAQYYGEMGPIPDFDKAYEYNLRQAEFEPDNAIIFYTIGVNRFSKAYRLQNVLSLPERKKLAEDSEKNLKKAIDIDPTYSYSYAFLNLLYRNVFAKIYPEREARYIAEADAWQERFRDVRKREVERQRLEEELKKGEIK
jgi:tetratricopeptide (TPR) repeat protein